MAIAEWPTESGPVDWALFRGLKSVAVVEAKAGWKDVPGHLRQNRRYSRGFLLKDGASSSGGPWHGCRVPFIYATNGRPFVRECKEASGIWFQDLRSPTAHPRALTGWHSPAGVLAMLKLDTPETASRLSNAPFDFDWLRDYQKDAIKTVESRLAGGARDMLVAMATGTGKTRVCLALLYRLLRADRFNRILYLVDREALGDQAAETFKEVRVKGLRSFHDIYQIKELDDIRADPNTRLHIATIQGMVRRILSPLPGETNVPIDQYDCIVVDECHRGYILDRELSAEERWFKNQTDYLSKYRRVLDHFDAVRIGFTATPALHTTEIFGPPVYEYSYRQAVIDDWLVDHEPPIRIETRLSKKGIHWEKGAPLKLLDPVEGKVSLETTPDELDFDVAEFNRKVLTESFNRTVCEHLASEIDPALPGKSLVFCVNDRHADLVVRLMKECLDAKWGPVDDATVEKITGSIDRPMEAIRKYKNEKLPKIAVTVDLLTTGIDVPEIVNLVFLRRVRSRILYDQMIGRATRLCPSLYGEGKDKEVFRIFDAVDLYPHIRDLTAMTPVAAAYAESIANLVARLCTPDYRGSRTTLRDAIYIRIRRKRTLLREHAAALKTYCGLDPDALLEKLRSATFGSMVALFRRCASLAAFLDSLHEKPSAPSIPISEHPDRLRRVTRGYGTAKKPEDFIEAFGHWLKRNMNRMPSLVVIARRPADLTRRQLREVEAALDEKGFSEASLRAAWRDATNADIAASIVGFIRAKAVGSPLIPYDERVDRALRGILASRKWTSPQRDWLRKLANQTKVVTVVDRETLDGPYFCAHGGFARLDRTFGGRLSDILHEFKSRIWTDVA